MPRRCREYPGAAENPASGESRKTGNHGSVSLPRFVAAFRCRGSLNVLSNASGNASGKLMSRKNPCLEKKRRRLLLAAHDPLCRKDRNALSAASRDRLRSTTGFGYVLPNSMPASSRRDLGASHGLNRYLSGNAAISGTYLRT